MGLIERIRAWWRRGWIPAAEFDRYREAVAQTQSREMGMLRTELANARQTIRELTEHNVKSLEEMREAHKRLLADDVGGDLARIITTVGLVAVRLDVLAKRLGIRVGDAVLDSGAIPQEYAAAYIAKCVELDKRGVGPP